MLVSRSARFANAPNISLAELHEATARATAPQPRPNAFGDIDRATIEREMLKRIQWRYHHDIPAILNSENQRTLLTAYARRVDTMFAMLDTALGKTGLDLGSSSICDLACAEGFVAGYLIDRGAKSIDCYELNEEQIERLHLVSAWKGRTGLNAFRTDLEPPFWALQMPHYDLTLCLGIVYHLENPMLFLRNAFEITNKWCIVESDTPGKADVSTINLVDQQVTKDLGDVRYILEARPSLKALTDMLLCVGFESVEHIAAPVDGVCPYLTTGKKSVLLAKKP